MSVRSMLRHFDEEDKLFAAHTMDLFDSVERGRPFRFTGFCDRHQAEVVRCIAAAYPFFLKEEGGAPDTERVVFRVSAEEDACPPFPICSILIRSYEELSHRDVLGSVMGLGLKRESVGDILRAEEGFVVLVLPPADRVLLNELDKVGHKAVKCECISLSDCRLAPREFQEKRGTVKSFRLDAVVSLCTGLSREKGKELVEKQKVFVDSRLLANPSAALPSECVLSIRGFGKFHVSCSDQLSQKGRCFVTTKKFI